MHTYYAVTDTYSIQTVRADSAREALTLGRYQHAARSREAADRWIERELDDVYRSTAEALEAEASR